MLNKRDKIEFFLSFSDKAKFDELSNQLGMTMSEVLRACVKEKIEEFGAKVKENMQ